MLVALLVCLIPTTIGGAAVGHRHRRHGPARAAQRAGHVAAAPSRPPATARRCCSTRPARSRSATARPPSSSRSPGVDRAASSPRPRCSSSLADETPEGRSIVVLAEERYGLARARRSPAPTLVPFTAQTRMTGVDARRPRASARAPPTRSAAGSRSRAARCPPSSTPIVERHRRDGRHAARRRRGRTARARRDPPQGHRQAGHARALRRAAGDGHPHGDDHRRQPAHRRGHRRRGRRRRLPRRGHARGQDGADQARAGRRATSWR